jgi:hypothetical protein
MVARDSDQTKLDSAELAQLRALAARLALKGIRKRSDYVFLGLPLYSIAKGPDLPNGELFGHAKGVLAIGDRATGIIAIGAFAVGCIAIGPVAVGLVALGGVSLGLVLAFGGAAIGLVALGGAALGVVAIGGAAEGYYAAGGAVHGAYVVDAMQQDPEAVAFFSQWNVLPWFGSRSGGRR